MTCTTLLSVFKKYQPEIVIHMAEQALVRYSYANPIETYSTNVMGTVNMLEAARQTGTVRAIVNGSGATERTNRWEGMIPTVAVKVVRSW